MPPVSKKFKITETEVMDLVPTECFKQGAEGRIFKTEYLGRSVLVKERFSKKYRHPKLDEMLTKERTTSEIRGLMKSRSAGIRTPAVYAVNSPKNQIIMEFIEGKTVKDILLILEESVKENNIPQCDESEMIVDDNDDSNDDDDINEPREEKIVKNGKTKNRDAKSSKPVLPAMSNIPEDISLDETTKSSTQTLLEHLHSTTSDQSRDLTSENIENILTLLSLEIGSVLSTMHLNNIIHGDLTTSNMIFTPDHNLVLIDFGLSQIKISSEDKAVDLYVLKRAILSLHSIFSKKIWDCIVASYRLGNRKQFETVMKTFQEVELRGRKRCMVG